ncbi:GHKL domain-containing protein [Chitinophaga eiseniae]|uniref:GHKL domain-containing protein n=1 Tax=Chitinophaga eiseniae TaxID=634771 RepID=A0A1T4QL91_9BACT|nr:histidine kinase [Chitinophaga eiseniae]SKA04241.1 GHKL domain-containing protein [Chitinophaga eiseniae]
MKTFLSSKYINIALHTLIWGVLLLLPYVVSSPENQYSIGPMPGIFFTIAGVIHMGLFYGNAFYLCPRLLNRRYWWLYVPAALLLLFISFQLKYHIMATWFPGLLQNKAAYRFVFGPSVAVLVISLLYRKILDRIYEERRQKEKQAEQLSTELKFLRSQISPHFLFNVLTNMVSLARKKSDQLETSLIMLSELMRYMLYNTGGAKVSLQKEVTYLNSYIALQELRFGSDVDIRSDMPAPGSLAHYLIEPMLLIPFVENAFKHGTGGDKPTIRIQLSVQEDVLTFIVENHVDQVQDISKDDSSGIGLANVTSRLELLYHHHYTLTVNNDNNRFLVHLTLKLI